MQMTEQTPHTIPGATLLRRFTDIVGEKHALTESDDLTRYTHENRELVTGKTPLVLKPANTNEVSLIVRLAAESRVAIVPQGGHTGHAGGAVPDETGTQIVVSLERMNAIREIDLEGNVLVCEAGTVLETIQNVARENDRLFPLSLGSQGSCQIGGNISSNAGGTGVLAYGNTRALVMGLEVVLPSGEIWNGMRRLKKDNTGYDLKDLFIGAEGTLGIVTACVLKLFPAPRGRAVAICGLSSPENALKFLGVANSLAGHSLTAFELMGALPMSFTLEHMDKVRNPLQENHDWYVLAEISSGRSQEDADALLEQACAEAFEAGVLDDAALSASFDQADDFWRIRDLMSLAQKHEGGSMKHDVSVPVHLVPEFLKRADGIVLDEIPDARLCTFGHLGDGNMHYNISQPKEMDKQAFLDLQPHVNKLVFRLVTEMGGSVAAEHGIGRFKKTLLQEVKDGVELSLMKSLKTTLDPLGIMNPGKVI